MLHKITPLILTFNEAPNIDRTLEKLTWAKQILVIDSYSTDSTLEILQSYPQVQIFQREFDNHTNQWNYGLQQVKTEWVLSLDADYLLTDDLMAELDALPKDAQVDNYFAKFKYCVFGKALRGTLLPPPVKFSSGERKPFILMMDTPNCSALMVNRGCLALISIMTIASL